MLSESPTPNQSCWFSFQVSQYSDIPSDAATAVVESTIGAIDYLGGTELVACKLRQLREHHKLTRQQVADRTGVTVQTLYHLEKSENMPNLKTAYHLARLFGVKVEDIWTVTPCPPR